MDHNIVHHKSQLGNKRQESLTWLGLQQGRADLTLVLALISEPPPAV